jgi:hypothetical protein
MVSIVRVIEVKVGLHDRVVMSRRYVVEDTERVLRDAASL